MAIGKPYAVRISRVSQADPSRGYYVNFGDNFKHHSKLVYVEIMPQGNVALNIILSTEKAYSTDRRFKIYDKNRVKIGPNDFMESFVGEYKETHLVDSVSRPSTEPITRATFRIMAEERSVFTNLYKCKSAYKAPVKVVNDAPLAVEEPGPDIFEKCLTGEVKKEEEVPMQSRTMSYWARKQEQYNNIILDPIKKDIASIEAEIAKLQTRKEKLETTLEMMGKLYSKGAIKLP